MSDTPKPLRRALLTWAADPACPDDQRERIVTVHFKALDSDHLREELGKVRRYWNVEETREELLTALILEDERAREGRS